MTAYSIHVGSEKLDFCKTAYNFHVSQLRIRIEMSFALLCGKWAILRKPLQVKVRNVGNIVLCCAQLHNFVINERLHDSHDDAAIAYPDPEPEVGSAPGDYADNDEYDRFYDRSAVDLEDVLGTSETRELLLQKISDCGLYRPSA
jgi:DDE superfamily endonuclease